MTENEWLKSSDPLAMLGFLFGPMDRASEEVCFARKKLLLDCACYSRLVRLLPLYARVYHAHAMQAAEGQYPKDLLGGEDADCEIQWAIHRATKEEAGRLRALLDLWAGCYHTPENSEAFHAEREAQAALVRDIYGNPFRSVALDSSCAAAPVRNVARMIYDANAFECMDRLVEVLEQAGCTNKEILEHCRGPGPHVRGCWVVDLLLGKEEKTTGSQLDNLDLSR